MSKHSPAPWTLETGVDPVDFGHGPEPETWVAIYDAHRQLVYSDRVREAEGSETMLANARLFAAAPRLLAACQMARAFDWKSGLGAGDVYEALRAAVEDAEPTQHPAGSPSPPG